MRMLLQHAVPAGGAGPAERTYRGGVDHDPLSDLPMTSSPLDREGPRRDREGRLAELLEDPAALVLDLSGDRARLRSEGGLALRRPTPEDADRLVLHLGRHEETEYLAVCHPWPQGPEAGSSGVRREERLDAAPFVGLRQAVGDLSAVETALFTTAVGLANWHHRHPFCPRCGHRTHVRSAGWVRHCPNDDSEHYPRTDPAVIMSVIDERERILLARNTSWPEGRFSVLAGFVEPGETIAAAVAREVGEETGVHVADVEFVADQPWPFPTSLMLGCAARAVTTSITPQPEEIAEARWFTREEFVAAVGDGRILTAGRMSIAARLIERWLGRRLDDLA